MADDIIKVRIEADMDFGAAQEQLAAAGREIRGMKEEMADMPNVSRLFNSSLEKTASIIDSVSGKVETLRRDGFEDEDKKARFIQGGNEAIKDANVMHGLQVGSSAYGVQIAREWFKGLPQAVQKEFDAITPRVTAIMRSRMSSLTKDGIHFTGNNVEALTSEMLSDKEVQKLVRSSVRHADQKQIEGYIQRIIPNAVAHNRLSGWQEARYGSAMLPNQDAMIQGKPETLFPASYVSSFKDAHGYRRATLSEEQSRKVLTKERFSDLGKVFAKYPIAVRAAIASGIARRDDRGVLETRRDLTMEDWEGMREALYSELENRATGAGSKRIDMYGSDPKTQRDLARRLTSSSAGQAMLAMHAVEAMSKPEAWVDKTNEAGYVKQQTEARRVLDRYATLKYSPFLQHGDWDKNPYAKENGQFVMIPESQNTKLLGQGKWQNNQDISGTVALISLAGYNPEDKKQFDALRDLYANGKVINGVDMVAQSTHGNGDSTTVRMVARSEMERVEKAEQEWARQNGFSGSYFQNYTDAQRAEMAAYDAAHPGSRTLSEKVLGKQYDAENKGWSPSADMGLNLAGKRFAVVDLGGEGDGSAWMSSSVMPYANQARFGIAGKGSVFTYNAANNREFARNAGFLDDQGRWMARGLNGEMYDIAGYDGIIPADTVKNLLAYGHVDQQTGEFVYGKAYTNKNGQTVIDTSNEAISEMMTAALQRYGPRAIANYEQENTNSNRLGTQMTSFMALSPELRAHQAEMYAQRMRELDTEEGQLRYVFTNPEEDWVAKQVHENRQLLATPTAQKRVDDYRASLQQSIAAGQYIDFGQSDTKISDIRLADNPLRSLLAATTDEATRANVLSKMRNAMSSSYDRKLEALTGRGASAEEIEAFKQGHKRDYTDQELLDLINLSKNANGEERIIDFAHMNQDHVGVLRSPTGYGNMVYAQNIASEVAPIFDAFKMSRTGAFVSKDALETLQSADYDGDRAKIVTGELATAVQRTKEVYEEQMARIKGADTSIKKEAVKYDADLTDEATQRALAAGRNVKEVQQMGGSSGGIRGMQLDLSNPTNNPYIIAQKKMQEMYDVNSVYHKNPQEVDLRGEREYWDTLKLGKEFTKFTDKAADLFQYDPDQVDQRGQLKAEAEDIFRASNGQAVNMRRLKQMGIDTMNLPSINMDTHLMGVGQTRRAYLEGGSDTTRWDAIAEALGQLEFPEGAGEKTKALMSTMRQMFPQFGSGQRGSISREETSALRTMISEAEAELGRQAEEGYQKGFGIYQAKHGDDVTEYKSKKEFIEGEGRRYGIFTAKNAVDVFGLTQDRLENRLGQDAAKALENDPSLSAMNDAVAESVVEQAQETAKAAAEEVTKSTKSRKGKGGKSRSKKAATEVPSTPGDEPPEMVVCDICGTAYPASLGECPNAANHPKKQTAKQTKRDQATLSNIQKAEADPNKTFEENFGKVLNGFAGIESSKALAEKMMQDFDDTIKGHRRTMNANKEQTAADKFFGIETWKRDKAHKDFDWATANLDKSVFGEGTAMREAARERLDQIDSGYVGATRQWASDNSKNIVEGMRKSVTGVGDEFDKQQAQVEAYANSIKELESVLENFQQSRAKLAKEAADNGSFIPESVSKKDAETVAQLQKDLAEAQALRDQGIQNIKTKNNQSFMDKADSLYNQMYGKTASPLEKVDRQVTGYQDNISTEFARLKEAHDKDKISEEDYVARRAQLADLRQYASGDLRRDLYNREFDKISGQTDRMMMQSDRMDRQRRSRTAMGGLARFKLQNEAEYQQREQMQKSMQSRMDELVNARDGRVDASGNRTGGMNKNSEEYARATQEINKLNTAMEQNQNAMNGLTGPAGNLNAAFGSLSNSVNRLAMRFGRQLFMKALNEAKKFVKDFNKTMAEIQMITLKTDSEMSTLGNGLIEQAKKLKVSISDITKSAATLYRQGLSDQEVNDRLEVISKFSKVSGTKVEDATKLITIAMNTGLVTDASEASDIVTALGDNAATNAAQIEKGIEKSGAAAAADGTSFGQLVAMLTAILSTTQIGGSTAGRTMNTIFGRMNKIGTNELIYDANGHAISGSAVAKLLKEQGIDTYDSEGNKRSSFDVLYDLSKKWDSISDAEQQQLATAIAGTRQYSNFSAIMQGMAEGDIDEYMKLIGESGGITDEKYAIYMQTLEASITNVKNAFDSLIATLTDTGALTGFLDVVATLIAGFEKAAKATNGWAIKLPLLAAAVGAAAMLIEAHPVVMAIALGTVALTQVISAISDAAGPSEAEQQAAAREAAESRLSKDRETTSEAKTKLDRAKELNEKQKTSYLTQDETEELARLVQEIDQALSGAFSQTEKAALGLKDSFNSTSEQLDAYTEALKLKEKKENARQFREGVGEMSRGVISTNLEGSVTNADSREIVADLQEQDRVRELLLQESLLDDGSGVARFTPDAAAWMEDRMVNGTNTEIFDVFRPQIEQGLKEGKFIKYWKKEGEEYVPVPYEDLEELLTDWSTNEFYDDSEVMTQTGSNAAKLWELIMAGPDGNGASNTESIIAERTKQAAATVKETYGSQVRSQLKRFDFVDDDLAQMVQDAFVIRVMNRGVKGEVMSEAFGEEDADVADRIIQESNQELYNVTDTFTAEDPVKAMQDYVVTSMMLDTDFMEAHASEIAGLDEEKKVEVLRGILFPDESFLGRTLYRGQEYETREAAIAQREADYETFKTEHEIIQDEEETPNAARQTAIDWATNYAREHGWYDSFAAQVAETGGDIEEEMLSTYFGLHQGQYSPAEEAAIRAKTVKRAHYNGQDYTTVEAAEAQRRLDFYGNEENAVGAATLEAVESLDPLHAGTQTGLATWSSDKKTAYGLRTDKVIRGMQAAGVHDIKSLKAYVESEGEQDWKYLTENNGEFARLVDSIQYDNEGNIINPEVYDQVMDMLYSNSRDYGARNVSATQKAGYARTMLDTIMSGQTAYMSIEDAQAAAEAEYQRRLDAHEAELDAQADAYAATLSTTENSPEAIREKRGQYRAKLAEENPFESETASQIAAGYRVYSDAEKKYLEELVGTELYQKLVGGTATREEQAYANTLIANRQVGLTTLTSSQQLTGMKDVRAHIETLGRSNGYSRAVADQYMSSWSGWNEYAALMEAKNTGNTELFEQLGGKERLDELTQSLDTFQENSEIKIEIEGVKQLEDAGKIASGVSAEIEKLRKGGKVALEVTVKYQTEAFESGQQTAKLYSNDALMQDEAAMAILGMSSTQYYADREANLARAQETEQAGRAYWASTWEERYNAEGIDEAQRERIRESARLAGYTLTPDYEDYVLPAGYTIDDYGTVYDAGGHASYEETEKREAAVRYRHFAFSGVPDVVETNPFAGQKKSFSETELANARARMLNGETKETIGTDLYDAAASGMGTYGTEYMRLLAAGETPSERLKQMALYENSEESRALGQTYRTSAVEHQKAVLAAANVDNAENRSVLASYLEIDEDQVLELSKKSTNNGTSNALLDMLQEKRDNLVRTISQGLEEEFKDINADVEGLQGLDLGDVTDFDSLVSKLREAAANADDATAARLNAYADALEKAKAAAETDLSEAFDQAQQKLRENTYEYQGISFLREAAKAYNPETDGDFITFAKGYTTESGQTWNNDWNTATSNNTGIVAASMLMQRGAITPEQYQQFATDQLNGAGKDSAYYDLLMQAGLGNNYQNGQIVGTGLRETLEAMKSDEALKGIYDELIQKYPQLEDVADGSSIALKRVNEQLKADKASDVTKYAKGVDGLAETMTDLAKGGTDAAKAEIKLKAQMDQLADQQLAIDKARGKSGKQLKKMKDKGDQTLDILAALIPEYDAEQLANMSQEKIDELLNQVQPIIGQQFADTIESLWSMLPDTVVNLPINDLIHVNADGQLELTEFASTLREEEQRILNIIMSLLGTYATVDVRAMLADGRIDVEALLAGIKKSGIKTGGGYSRGNNKSGGGGKSKTDALIEGQGHYIKRREHDVNMAQQREARYEYANNYQGYINALDDEIAAQERLKGQYEANIAALRQQLATLKEGSEEWYKCQEAIDSAEEAMAKIDNEIDSINSKKINITETKQANEDKPISHASTMLKLKAENYLEQGQFEKYEAVTRAQIANYANDIQLNNNQIAEWEELLKTYEEGSQDWINVRDKIWALKEENAELENNMLKETHELDQARISQIATDLQTSLAPLEHEQNMLGTWGGIYQKNRQYGAYRGTLASQNAYNEGQKALYQNSIAELQKQMQTLEVGSQAWLDARSAIYEYQEALASATAAIQENDAAIEESYVTEVTQHYQDASKSVEHELKMAQTAAEGYKNQGDYTNYEHMLEVQRDLTGNQLSVQKDSLAEMEALFNSGKLKEGSEQWRALREQIMALRETVAQTENDYASMVREVNTAKFEDAVEKFNTKDNELQHEIRMVQYDETKYQNAGELTNYGKALEYDNGLQKERANRIQEQIDLLKEQRDAVKDDPQLYNKIDAEIMKMEESLASTNNTIEKNNKLIEKNQDAIRKLQQNIENTLDKEIKAREKLERDMLAGTITAQNSMLEVIKKRYQDEFNLVKKDIENKKKALNQEKSLINERLNARKKAIDEEDKYETLAEYQKQLALISADPTRTKDAKELRRKIADLQKEISWTIAEEEAKAATDAIDDQIQALDDYVQVASEDLTEMLEDSNNFADELNRILGGSFEEYLAWMKENSETYKNATAETREQMEQGWHDTWLKMKGETETYWEEVAALMQNKDDFLAFMKQSQEYINASESGKASLEYQWSQAFDDYQASLIDNATFGDNHDVLEKMSEMKDWTYKVEPIVDPSYDYGQYSTGIEYWYQRQKDDTTGVAQAAIDQAYDQYSAIVGSEASLYESQRKKAEESSVPQITIEVSGGSSSGGGGTKTTPTTTPTTTDTDKYFEIYDERGIRTNYVIKAKDKSAAKTRLKNTLGDKYYSVSGSGMDTKPTWATKVYKHGGLIDFTGPAWVDGTPSQPEGILSAYDTKAIQALTDVLTHVYVSPGYAPSSDYFRGNTNIGDINVTINQAELKDDADFEDVAKRVGRAFTKQLNKDGFNLGRYAF